MNQVFNHVVCSYLWRILPVLLLTSFAFDARAMQRIADAKARGSDVEAMLSSEHVRFRIAQETAALQLSVFNQAGELVYESAEVARAELIWGLKDAADKPLMGGLYAYTLTVKRADRELSEKRQGHLIIEQTGRRVWLTTQGDVGVEGQDHAAVVSGGSEGGVAGVNINEVEAVAAEIVTGAAGNKIAKKSNNTTEGVKGGVAPPTEFLVDGTGTVGRIPKWISTTDIGNSVITETASGRIGIGTSAPTWKLEVRVNSGGAIAGSGSTGVYGVAPNAGNGVMGEAHQGMGVVGSSTGSYGILGQSTVNVGVAGIGPQYGVLGGSGDVNGIGVRGVHSWAIGTQPGILGETNSTDANAVGVLGTVNPTNPGPFSAGVFGMNNGTGWTGFGVMGKQAGSGWGVYGETPSGIGVYGVTNSTGPIGIGVKGRQAGSGWGVYGEAPSGRGVFGSSSSGQGVYGLSQTDAGVRGSGFFGVYGEGAAASFAGVYGIVPTGGSGFVPYAGYFAGNVHASGTLSKAGGSFKIDHPLDPANKYFSHSFVESPDMKNIYDGVVSTDETGEAIVKLPDWFEVLNRDFRYQLTVIGSFAQAIVASEVKDNRFAIRTSAPGVKVSWQVTGIRQDAWANVNRIKVEEDKAERERGYYLHPEVFNQPEERSVEWSRHPEMMQRMKESRLKQLEESKQQAQRNDR